MTKQLITLIGALVSIAVLALAVVLGVLPLVGGATGAIDQTAQAATTNATYQSQVDALKSQKERLDEIDASVAGLRKQIPGVPLLDEAFAIIAGSARSADAGLTSITRGDLAVFTPRATPIPAGPGAAVIEQQPVPTPTPDATTPIDQAENTADAANDNTDQANAASGSTPPATPAPVAGSRQQIPVSLTARADDMDAVKKFLDGLRSSTRLLAVDHVIVSNSGGFDIQVDLIAFVSPDTGSAE